MQSRNESPAGIFSQVVESALLVGVQWPGMSEDEATEHLTELGYLIDTMGLAVADSMLAKIRGPHTKFLVGTGKAAEIADAAKDLEVDCIVFDDDLSPSQQRNWEEMSDICVIDRHEVILDIFASRASTREAVLQVGLARMEYSLPRLTRAWTHLSRQRGGRRGTRGEGETQLEADRRVVLRKITKMKKELKSVRLQRGVQRRQRRSVPMPTAAIVGYTNSGKSTLLNALTDAEVQVEDKLFATLDPTTRRLPLHNGSDILLTDTVGFIRKLPHDLVDAFKSTLEETAMADFLVHLLDASNLEVDHHRDTTNEVLEEIGAGGKPTLVVFNKVDAVAGPDRVEKLTQDYPGALFVSARENIGLEELVLALKGLVYEHKSVDHFEFPADRHDLVALVHRTGRVVDEEYGDSSILVSAQLPEKIRGQLSSYLTSIKA